MTKLALQKELLEKIKPGTKPSDLKKPKNSQIPTPPSSPLIEPIKANQDQAKTPDLPSQISSLQNQLQLYKDFKEADLKIKEKLKEERQRLLLDLENKDKENEALRKTIKDLQQNNTLLNKTITDLKNQAKASEKETKNQSTQTTPTHFYCDNCQQNKHGSYLLRKIDSPFTPRTHGKLCYLCSTCQKYTKEYNEAINPKEDNPYKLYD